jgi:hypothetical protein
LSDESGAVQAEQLCFHLSCLIASYCFTFRLSLSSHDGFVVNYQGFQFDEHTKIDDTARADFRRSCAVPF